MIFDQVESQVRSYSRTWPVIFSRASGSWLYTDDRTPYLDFFSGAGALNYGHNDPVLVKAMIDYIAGDGVIHALDMFTQARHDLLLAIQEVLLAPRGLDYRVAFPGPAGTTAVEAALKLARKVTGRSTIAHFDHAFHGMTLGALGVSGTEKHRRSAGVALPGSFQLPYDLDPDAPSSEVPDFDQLFEQSGACADLAAVIVEGVQGEGGMYAARPEFMRALADACRRAGALLIVDDIQMGCGRTGPFFTFEDSGITPDLVCLSKSISGTGCPMALLLIRPELDVWTPGEHNGTFRGFNPAFVTATQALRLFWSDDRLEKSTRSRGDSVAAVLGELVAELPEDRLQIRGRGLGAGLRFADPGQASRVREMAFSNRLLVETSGQQDDVVKLLPPLTISDRDLDVGLSVLVECTRAVVHGRMGEQTFVVSPTADRS